MKKICFVTFLIIILLASLPAEAKMKKLGQAGMSFLAIGGSARAAGMADVFTFVKNDLSSVFYNPAGLATVEKRSFYFNYTSWIADMSVSHLAVSWNLDKYGVVALHGQLMDYGTFNGTAISDTDPKGYADIDVGDVSGLALGVGYGIRMTDRFSIGGNIKYVKQQLGQNQTFVADVVENKGNPKENKIDDLAFDFGTTYDTGIRSIVLSMSIRNYAQQQLFENEEFMIPQTYKIGISADLFQLLPYSPGENHSALLAIEGVDPSDRPEFLNLGLEYTLMNMISLRGGWAAQRAQDGVGGICAGAGFNLNTEAFSGRVDLAYSDFGSILGSVMRVSLSGAF
ncbi:PorV/PorQ family protein [candidate division KSB1 bacterium]|nr:PorV/PorQ family protein [candidate division KSB1 bacterium]